MAAKAAIGTGCRHASVPPATTTSARPVRIIWRAYATASAPEAQAETGVCTPARAENSRPTYAAGPLGMSIGMVCGETLRGPFSRRVSHWLSSVCAPPMPVATTTPRRSLSTSGAPASVHASRAAMSASCSARSRRRPSTRSSTSRGSTATCAAIRTGSSSAHGSSMTLTPERPDSRPSHVEAASPPTGVDAPRPVTTTRGCVLMCPAPLGVGMRLSGSRLLLRTSAGSPLDVRHRVADRLEVLDLVVGDLHAELLLGRDHDLDHGERVDVEVVGERLVELYVGGGHACDLVDDLGEAGQDLLLGGHAFSFGDVNTGRGPGRCDCGPSGQDDHLRGVRETGAEPEEQRQVAAARLARLEQPADREGDRCGGRVPRVDDVLRDNDVLGELELLDHRIDDPQVRLVRHEDVEVVGGHASRPERLSRHVGHVEDGPVKDLLTLHREGGEGD